MVSASAAQRNQVLQMWLWRMSRRVCPDHRQVQAWWISWRQRRGHGRRHNDHCDRPENPSGPPEFEWPPACQISMLWACRDSCVYRLLSSCRSPPPLCWRRRSKKKPPQWKGYGFLPGYHQPLNNSVPLFMQARGPAYGQTRPAPVIYRPYARSITAGPTARSIISAGPASIAASTMAAAWAHAETRTPIGPIWNCG